MHSMKKLIQPPRSMKSGMHKVKINIMNNHVNQNMCKETDWVERPRTGHIFLHREGIKGRGNDKGESVHAGCERVSLGGQGIVTIDFFSAV